MENVRLAELKWIVIILVVFVPNVSIISALRMTLWIDNIDFMEVY